MKKSNIVALGLLFVVSMTGLLSCSISYKFNGASIDYSKVKTISIADFPNMAESVYAPLSSMFSEALRDKYSRQTRLQLERSGGDMDIEGEIVNYDTTPMAIGGDGLAAKTKLTLTVTVRYTNRRIPEEDFEKRYSASKDFESNRMLTDVQDELLTEMIEDITDQIFNDTAAKW